MVRRLVWWVLVLGALPATAVAPTTATAQETEPGPVVHGVLFYSPTCPHCRDVMTEYLPPIIARYGPAMEIVTINVATEGGQQLYRATVETFALTRERIGVPTLLVGDSVLVGAWEIPNLLPAIIDTALAAEGIDWPPVPLIRQALAAQGLIAQEDVAIAETDEPDRVAARDTGTRDTSTAAADADEAAAEEAAADEAAGPDTADREVAEAEVAEAEVAEGDATGEEATGEEAAGEGAGADAPIEAAPAPAPDSTRASREPAGPEVSREPVAPAGADTAPGGDPAPTPEPVEPGPDSGSVAGSASSPDDTLDPALAEAIDPEGRMALVHELPVSERLMLDPAGNGLAIAVLILMLVALGLVVADVAGGIRIPAPPPWAIPLLSLVGLGVAAYLAFVEVTGAEAVCGPVGNCNVVQQSPYARLLGVPVGVLGVLGYAVLLAVWSAGRLVGAWAPMARTAVWWMALGATGFSIYLTFLEPFVIGASCAWCLTSAVATTLILLAATPERYARDRVGVSPTSRPTVSH